MIDETAKTVTVNVPFGTDVTSLVADFSVSGVATTVNGVEQESGVTANDFEDPVAYTVKAEDNSTTDYTVTVIVGTSDAKEITAITIAGQISFNISGTDITVVMPSGADPSSLTPDITHTGASINPASGTAQDFTNPVVYTVTAADSSTIEYTVSLTFQGEVTKVFDFMTDGDALVRDDGSDWYFDGGNTGNYSNGFGYYMNQTRIISPWFFTGDFTVDFEFYLKVLDDDYIYRYGFSLIDPNWESTPSFFDFAAYYTAFPPITEIGTETYYQVGQGHGSDFSYNEYYVGVPGAHSGVNTCTLVKSGSNVSIYMNDTLVKTVVVDQVNLPDIGYSPSIQGHNSWDQADSNFYLRTVTIHYMAGEVEYINWNE